MVATRSPAGPDDDAPRPLTYTQDLRLADERAGQDKDQNRQLSFRFSPPGSSWARAATGGQAMTSNLTALFLGDTASWEAVHVELWSVQGLWGGWIISLAGDGAAVVRRILPGAQH